jgi:hypothetical protein
VNGVTIFICIGKDIFDLIRGMEIINVQNKKNRNHKFVVFGVEKLEKKEGNSAL